MQHMTYDAWQVVNIVYKFQVPRSLSYFKELEEKDCLINQSVTEGFVEQPQLNRVC